MTSLSTVLNRLGYGNNAVEVIYIDSENRGWVIKERVHSDGQVIRAVKTDHQGEWWIDPSVMAPG